MDFYPQVGVELVQHQTHGARQIAHVRRFLVQSVLENLKVLHPLHRKAVVDDVRLHKQQECFQFNSRPF